MGFRSNQPTSGRDFFFYPAGDNELSGTSDENPVADPDTAITNVNALTPPPGPSDPASINASVTGAYSDGVTVPRFVTCNAASASILTFDAVNVECLGRHSVEWGSLLNFSDGTCVKIDGQNRISVTVNSCVPLGDDSVGFAVSGVCEEIFCNIKEGSVIGDRAMMLDHTANSPVPIQYVADIVIFSGNDQTIIRYNDPVGTTESIFNISAIQPQGSPTNSTILELIAGLVVMDCEVMVADTLAVVKNGAQLGLDCVAASGDTIIEAGGLASYKSVGELVGDVDVSGGMALTTNSMTGDLTVTGTGNALANIDTMTGDITVESGGVLFIDCDVHVGTVTPSDPSDGRINGIIEGVRYGNRLVDIEDTVTTETYTQQVPQPDGSGGMELVVKFGGHYQYEDDEDEDSTSSTSYQNKLTLTTPSLPAGTYRVEYHAEVTNDSGDKPVETQIEIDSMEVNEYFYAPKFEDEYFLISGFRGNVVWASGVHTAEINWRATSEGGNAKIRRARMEVYRIS